MKRASGNSSEAFAPLFQRGRVSANHAPMEGRMIGPRPSLEGVRLEVVIMEIFCPVPIILRSAAVHGRLPTG